MKPSKYLATCFAIQMLFWSHLPLNQNQEQLKQFPSVLPPQQLFGGHYLPLLHLSCPWAHSSVWTRYTTTEHRIIIFFFLVGPSLKGTEEPFFTGKGDVHHCSLAPACATVVGTHYMPGDANPAPSVPCLISTLKTPLRDPQRRFMLWQALQALKDGAYLRLHHQQSGLAQG